MEITSVLPDDVLEEILLRLPVKHLLRFKCVCKQWHALIEDYGFQKTHYHFQYAMHVAEHNDIPFFLDSTRSYNQDELLPSTIYLLSKRQGADVVLDEITRDFERDVSAAFVTDLKQDNLRLLCYGIVNGVIGVQWGYSSFTEAALGRNPYNSYEEDCARLALWNPATREFKSLPCWPKVPANEATRLDRETILGFGFDLQSNDFKILVWLWFRFEIEEEFPYLSECLLYSLKANSWRKINDCPNSLLRFYNTDPGVHLDNGVSYWVAREGRATYGRKHTIILSFNFSTEIYKEFEIPGCRGGECRYTQLTASDNERELCHCSFRVEIGKYKEGLALFLTNSPYKEPEVKIEIWEGTKFHVDDCRVPVSWQLVLRVQINQSFSGVWLTSIRVSGDLLLLIQRSDSEEDELGCLYNPSTCTLQFLEFGIGTTFNYMESLFSLSRLT